MFQDLKAARVDRDRKHRPPGLKMSDTFVMLFVQVHYWHLVLPFSRLFESRPFLCLSIVLASRGFAVRLFAGLKAARVDRGRKHRPHFKSRRIDFSARAGNERHLHHALRPGPLQGYLAEKKQRPPRTLQ